MTSLTDLPMLATPKQVAELLGLKTGQMRTLIHSGRIAHVRISRARVMIPRDAIATFVAENTVKPCRDETRDRASIGSKSAAVTTSSGQKAGAAGSAHGRNRSRRS